MKMVWRGPNLPFEPDRGPDPMAAPGVIRSRAGDARANPLPAHKLSQCGAVKPRHILTDNMQWRRETSVVKAVRNREDAEVEKIDHAREHSGAGGLIHFGYRHGRRHGRWRQQGIDIAEEADKLPRQLFALRQRAKIVPRRQ